MTKKKNFDILISDLEKFFSNKSKGLHDPIFFGNEIKYLKQCINSGYVSYVGDYVKKFEKKICSLTKSKYSVATSSGTSALHLALKYYNIGKNDEVLLPSCTYVATANAIKYCNATPNFLDLETDNLGICPEKLEKYLSRISKKSGNKLINKFTNKQIKVLIVVHVYGFPCKIVEIKKICRKYNLILIEDAAEAVGSYFNKKHLGTFGDMGILSFNGNKTITTGGGGAILVKRKKEAKKLTHLSTQANLKVKNDHLHDHVGYNYRMINLAAAVGCAQLENLNKIIKAKRKNFKNYNKIFRNFNEIKILEEPKNSKTNYWLITALFENKIQKNKFIKAINKKGFASRYTWRPLHLLNIFKNCPADNMKNSVNFYNRSANLPSSPILSIMKLRK